MFKKGMVRHPNAGRKPGAKNKGITVSEILAKRGINCIDELVDLYYDPDTENKSKVNIMMHLSKFIYATKKEVEHSGDVDVHNTLEVIKTEERRALNAVLSNPIALKALRELEATNLIEPSVAGVAEVKEDAPIEAAFKETK